MGSAEMTEGIWGKVSQLNAGEMPLPGSPVPPWKLGPNTTSPERLETAGPNYFFLLWLTVLNSNED